MKLEEIEALAGKTFERDGKRRRIVSVEHAPAERPDCHIIDIYWCRPGQRYTRRRPSSWIQFSDWLSQATEVRV